MHGFSAAGGLSRRSALTLLGAAGLGLSAAGMGVSYAGTGTSTPTVAAATGGTADCVAKPELTEGPYVVDEGLNRSDIRIEPSTGTRVSGTALALDLRILLRPAKSARGGDRGTAA